MSTLIFIVIIIVLIVRICFLEFKVNQQTDEIWDLEDELDSLGGRL